MTNASAAFEYMTVKQANGIIGGPMGRNSKMPCKAYSLPIANCAIGSTLTHNPGSVCHGCYAGKGFSTVFAKKVNPYRQRKLDALAHPMWIPAMISLLARESYFRWHDSGDLQSVAHLRMIVTVCNATPNCKHWMPTKQYNHVRAFLDAGGTIPDNLVIRLSGYMRDGKPPQPNGLVQLCTSTVDQHNAPIGEACKARNQDGQCLDCRACWDSRVKNVSYHRH